MRRLAMTALATLMLPLTACDGGPPVPTGPEDDLVPPALQSWVDRSGDVFWNPCTAEYVLFAEGSKERRRLTTRPDGAGGYHVAYHRNGAHFNGPGVEWDGSTWVPTGSWYRGNSVYNYHLHVRGPFPWNGSITSEVRVISTGSASNMMFHLVEHVTVNANGEVTAEVEDGWFTCA